MPLRYPVILVAVFCATLAQAQTLAVVSAATFRAGALAPAMIATGFHPALTGTANSYTVSVRDAAGSERPATVLAAGNGQINMILPAGSPPGNATVTIRSGNQVVATATVNFTAVAPGIFAANANGAGVPAGFAITVEPGGTQSRRELYAPTTQGTFLARPFPFGDSGRPVFLTFYGTGIRGWRNSVTATLGGRPVPVAAAVAQDQFVGLDQVNLGPLPAELNDRRGELELRLTVDGVAANPVTVALNAPDLGQWGARGELLEANSEMAIGELLGKVYVMGGYPASRATQSTVQVYDPASDRWELTTPMPLGLNHNMAPTVNGKLYMIGGQTTDGGSGNFSDRVFEYNADTREWRERTRMPTARGAGVAVVLDGKIYVAGGRPPRGADFAVYDPAADTWRTLPDLPTPRNHLAGAAMGGKVYIVGGRFEAGFQSPQSDAVEIYDPVTNAWSRGAPMPKPRGGINGLEAYGCLHVFGGEGNFGAPNGLHPEHDVYNPVTNSWTSLGPMPIPVHGVTGAVFLSGLIYLPGGGTSEGGSSGSRIHQVFRPYMVCR